MSPLSRIHRLKTVILALIALGSGIGLLTLANFVDHTEALHWLTYWPITELGSILAGAGILGIGYNYLVDRDKDARDDERVRRLLKESTPEFRDAVVKGFAVSPDDLRRVATPELLDSIAKNALGLRLGDKKFAAEVYEGLRDQAIRAPERWYDAQVRIRLSNHRTNGSGNGSGKSSASTIGVNAKPASGGGYPLPAPQFDILVQWEYTVTPSHPVRKFACTSDRDEFRDLITDVPSTSAWFMTPRPGLNPSDQASFELLQFTVDGEERRIRRSERKSGQTYSVNLGEDVVREGKPVRIGHTYRTLATKNRHWLSITVAQPTRDLSVVLDYTDTDIATVTTSDMISSAKRARVTASPGGVAARETQLEAPGWLLPPAEITYIWTLNDEEDAPQDRAAHASAA